jgi:hypothetical protein
MSSSSTQQPKTKKVKVSPPSSTIFMSAGDRDNVGSVDTRAGFNEIGNGYFSLWRSLISTTNPDIVTTMESGPSRVVLHYLQSSSFLP